MITTSTSTKAISLALHKFQGHVSGVKRDAKNLHFKSSYATLENVIDTVRPALQECGVLFMQAPGAVVDGSLEVTTRLTHVETDEWVQSTMHMPLGKRDPQGAGSATTYALRYSLMAMLGLPPTDDDGEAAMEREPIRRGKDDFREDGTKSSAALKRDGAWQKLMFRLSRDLGDCTSLHRLGEIRADYRTEAKKEGWTAAWLDALKNEFDTFEDGLKKAIPPVSDDDFFPGDKPSNLHMAG